MRVMSRRVEAIQYRHAEDGRPYQHDFKGGVELVPLKDGSVKLTRPDGRRVWDRFDGKPSRFLVNPPAGSLRQQLDVFRVTRADLRDMEPGEIDRPGWYYRVGNSYAYGPHSDRATARRVAREALAEIEGAGMATKRKRKANPPRRSRAAARPMGTDWRDSSDVSYRGYWIRRNALAGGLWIEKDGRAISGVHPEWGWNDARRVIDEVVGTNPPRGRKMARRKGKRSGGRAKARRARKGPSKKQLAARRRFAAMARARAATARSARATHGGKMARRKKHHRRTGGRRAHRRQNPPRRHFRRRSNPSFSPRNLVGGFMTGAIGGLAGVGGKVGAVMGARFLSFIPDTLVGSYTLSLKQSIAATVVTFLAGMLRIPQKLAGPAIVGAWMAPWESAIRQSGIPVLSTGLGECDTWGIAAYAPPNRAISGYAPPSRGLPSEHYAAVNGMAGYGPTGYSELGL